MKEHLPYPLYKPQSPSINLALRISLMHIMEVM